MYRTTRSTHLTVGRVSDRVSHTIEPTSHGAAPRR